MTEKRFTYDSKTDSILKDGEFWLDGSVYTACNHSEICDELNALNDENNQLKRKMEKVYNSLVDENEQLKQAYNDAKKDVEKKEQILKDIMNDNLLIQDIEKELEE